MYLLLCKLTPEAASVDITLSRSLQNSAYIHISKEAQMITVKITIIRSINHIGYSPGKERKSK